MEDFSVQMRLHNNQLKGRREELGLTQKALAAAIGIHLQAYCAYECFGYNRPTSDIAKPWNTKTKNWSKFALKIAAFYCVEPEELFPDSILSVVKNLFEKKVSKEAAHALISDSQKRNALPPDHQIDERLNLKAALDKAMVGLSPNERHVLTTRFLEESGDTNVKLGETLGVSGNRIYQIEANALRKLRHSRNSCHLKGFVDNTPNVPASEAILASYHRVNSTKDISRLTQNIKDGEYKPQNSFSIDRLVRTLLTCTESLAYEILDMLVREQENEEVQSLLNSLRDHHAYIALYDHLGISID